MQSLPTGWKILSSKYLHREPWLTVRHDEIGKFRFFVAHIDADGYEHPIWDGAEYDKAIGMAERMRSIVGAAVPIRDDVGGVAR